MKKLAASILLLIYFTVSTGFVVSIHYCMNKVDSVQLGDGSSEECGKCGMHIEDSGGCCKDDVKMVKMQVDQSFAKIAATDLSFIEAPVALANEYYLAPFKNSTGTDYPLAHGPPSDEQDTYLQNCVFRL
jgi:hypothetical protein